MAFRIRTAGGEAARFFTREAVTQIHESSGGIPRVISVICDNALVHGFALGRQPVGRDVILEVVRDFDLDAASNDVVFESAPEDALTASAPVGLLAPAATPAAAMPERHAEGPKRVLFEEAAPRRRFSLFGSSNRG
jgi:hypothetical protein